MDFKLNFVPVLCFLYSALQRQMLKEQIKYLLGDAELQRPVRKPVKPEYCRNACIVK